LGILGTAAQRDQHAINEAIAKTDEAAAIAQLEQVLDKYALAIVDINPESRVKVQPGPAKPELVEAGSRIFLVKVINKAGVTARLETDSANALFCLCSIGFQRRATKKGLADRCTRPWMASSSTTKTQCPSASLVFRSNTEFSKSTAATEDSAPPTLVFSVGQGTQDIGFRNEMAVLSTRYQSMPYSCGFATRAVRPRWRLHHPRCPGPPLSKSFEAPGTRPLFPAAGLSCQWRNDSLTRGYVYGDLLDGA